ncbi:MAG: hypothetical protein V3V12_08950 [Gammaproteobacteria bacterium]
MPYYIYKVTSGPTELFKTLEKLEEHESFKAAKINARKMRSHTDENENSEYKVAFAASELEAEEQLQTKREAPILREWEK